MAPRHRIQHQFKCIYSYIHLYIYIYIWPLAHKLFGEGVKTKKKIEKTSIHFLFNPIFTRVKFKIKNLLKRKLPLPVGSVERNFFIHHTDRLIHCGLEINELAAAAASSFRQKVSTYPRCFTLRRLVLKKYSKRKIHLDGLYFPHFALILYPIRTPIGRRPNMWTILGGKYYRVIQANWELWNTYSCLVRISRLSIWIIKP